MLPSAQQIAIMSDPVPLLDGGRDGEGNLHKVLNLGSTRKNHMKSAKEQISLKNPVLQLTYIGRF